jgi:phosphoglucosamine mutase
MTLFGTDGIRNRVGNLPFTQDALPRLGEAIARWAMQTHTQRPRILIAHDTRISCSWVSAALESGLLQYPITIRTADTLSTPAACLLAHINDEIDCGIIISASHNPFHDNGIKIIRKNGKISAEDELMIMHFFYNPSLTLIDYNNLGSRKAYATAIDDYVTHIINMFPKRMLEGKTIVLDCANGATYNVAQTIFERLGATTHMLYDMPNGVNINDNCGAVHPGNLARVVREQHADAGFAFDGDGDRIVAVSADGAIHNGDTILALLLDHPRYKQTSHVVGTIMSNHGFAHFLNQRDKKLVRANVGDKHVALALETNNLLLGGEQSGHIIMRDYMNTGDGIFTALRLLETFTINGNWAMHTFTPYPQVLINIPVCQKKDLSCPPFSGIIEEYETQLHAGRCVIRYSGTENLLRIMIEDDTLEHATVIGTALSQKLSKALNQ